ncbi:MAG: RNA methyltransferase [Sphingomonadales bacterium]|nr:RNA methyltransferase [Sphingomonadales bacterium]
MRGYFAIGFEGVSKTGNVGNLIRTANGFGAAFVFSVRHNLPDGELSPVLADTSKSDKSIPYYEYDSLEEMHLPKKCKIIGIELCDEAVDLPTFRHPQNAAYILGSERLSLSQGMMDACDHIIKIPTKFCLNVATAGAIVMYDRQLSFGKFGERAITPRSEPIARPKHVRGGPIFRTKRFEQLKEQANLKEQKGK